MCNLGPPLARSWPLLGCPWVLLGLFWALLGRSWQPKTTFHETFENLHFFRKIHVFSFLGALPGPPGGLLGASEAVLGALGWLLGRPKWSWVALGWLLGRPTWSWVALGRPWPRPWVGPASPHVRGSPTPVPIH